jgi:PAS domain S-box-containing protein
MPAVLQNCDGFKANEEEISRRMSGFLRGVIDTKSRITALEAHAIDIFVLGDAINSGIYVIDKNCKITASNHAYSEITGMWEHEYIGKSLNEILERFFYNKYSVAEIALRNKKIASGIGRSKRTNKDLLVMAIPVLDSDENVEEVISVLQDITESMALQDQLKNSMEKTELYLQELNYYRAIEKGTGAFISQSPSMEGVKTLINQVAPVDATVLITGETGVGKEVIAREIHQRSRRRNGPYIKVNCAAIPASLIESELFGYEKGAFTGASGQRKLGFFEMADGGTLLLDEIGEFPLELQAKLLRVLQEHELIRVGGTVPAHCDVRVLATTNRDLKAEVERGSFRKDLYYRLCVIPIEIPPLRDRIEDIPALAVHFANRFNSSYNESKTFDKDALEALGRYPWPGNVRELANVVERLMVITPTQSIHRSNIQAILGGGCKEDVKIDASSLKEAKETIEKRMILGALKETGSSHKAAKLLGIAQPTVLRKAKKYGITDW